MQFGPVGSGAVTASDPGPRSSQHHGQCSFALWMGGNGRAGERRDGFVRQACSHIRKRTCSADPAIHPAKPASNCRKVSEETRPLRGGAWGRNDFQVRCIWLGAVFFVCSPKRYSPGTAASVFPSGLASVSFWAGPESLSRIELGQRRERSGGVASGRPQPAGRFRPRTA